MSVNNGLDTANYLNRDASVPSNSAITMRAWIKRTSSTGAQSAAFSVEGTFYNQFQIGTHTDGDQVGVNAYDEGWKDAGASLTDGLWHHVVATYDLASTTLKVYVDGALTFTDNDLADAETPSNVVLLRSILEGGMPPFPGDIAEVAIWERVLTDGEVAADVAALFPSDTDDLWAYWPLLNNADNGDDSGNARDLTITGTLTNGADHPAGGAPAGLSAVGGITCEGQASSIRGGISTAFAGGTANGEAASIVLSRALAFDGCRQSSEAQSTSIHVSLAGGGIRAGGYSAAKKAVTAFVADGLRAGGASVPILPPRADSFDGLRCRGQATSRKAGRALVTGAAAPSGSALSAVRVGSASEFTAAATGSALSGHAGAVNGRGGTVAAGVASPVHAGAGNAVGGQTDASAAVSIVGHRAVASAGVRGGVRAAVSRGAQVSGRVGVRAGAAAVIARGIKVQASLGTQSAGVSAVVHHGAVNALIGARSCSFAAVVHAGASAAQEGQHAGATAAVVAGVSGVAATGVRDGGTASCIADRRSTARVGLTHGDDAATFADHAANARMALAVGLASTAIGSHLSDTSNGARPGDRAASRHAATMSTGGAVRPFGWSTGRAQPAPAPSTVAARMPRIVDQLARAGLVETPTWTQTRGNTLWPLQVSVRALPSAQVAAMGGEQDDRWLDVFVLLGAPPAYERDGILTFPAESRFAGDWRMLDDERRGFGAKMIRVRRCVRENVNAAGARRVNA